MMSSKKKIKGLDYNDSYLLGWGSYSSKLIPYKKTLKKRLQLFEKKILNAKNLIICSGARENKRRLWGFKNKLNNLQLDIRTGEGVDYIHNINKPVPTNLYNKFNKILFEFCPYTVYFDYPNKKKYKTDKDEMIIQYIFWRNIFNMVKVGGTILINNFGLFKDRQYKKKNISYSQLFSEKLTECFYIEIEVSEKLLIETKKHTHKFLIIKLLDKKMAPSGSIKTKQPEQWKKHNLIIEKKKKITDFQKIYQKKIKKLQKSQK